MEPLDPPLPASPVGVMRGVFELLTDADDTFLRMVGYTRKDFERGALNWREMTPPEFAHLDTAGMKQAAETGGFTAPYQKEFFRKDGSRVRVLLVCAFIPQTEGGWIGYAVDLSAATAMLPSGADATLPLTGPVPQDMYFRLVGELVRERSRILAMLDNTPSLIWSIDRAHRLLSFNEAFRTAQSAESGESLGVGDSVLNEAYPPEVLHTWRERYARAFAGEHFHEQEVNVIDGNPSYSQYQFSPIVDAAGAVVGATVVSHDVTARVEAESRLRASEARFRSLATSLPVGVLLAERGVGITYLNPRMAEIWGLPASALLGEGYLASVVPEDRAALQERVVSGRQHVRALAHTFRIARSDGSVRTVRGQVEPTVIDGSNAGFVGIVEDETERLAEAQRARQREKMESLGSLAGGIAHDFNNMLGVILGFGDLASSPVADVEQMRESLAAIRTASLRARDLVHKILAFSRRTERKLSPVDLADLTRESVQLLRATLPASVTIDLRLPPEPLIVHGEIAALQQVLVNLCTNAEHALRGRADGVLTIQLARETGPSGSSALLTISDNGPGLAPAARERIFEPFFTTKPPGEGTGMGLAVVHGIVTSHKGEIALVETRQGGATFRVRLPLVEGFTTRAIETAQAENRTGHVLVVEDEPMLARVATRALQRGGYTVSSCSSGDEALQMLARPANAFDIVLSDLSMPGMRGDELGRRLATARPELPFLLMSGFRGDLTLEDVGGGASRRAFLQKPFTPAEVVNAIQSLLRGASLPEDASREGSPAA